MFATKERLAVTLLFVLGLLALAHVGNYLQNADATGGRVRQWSVSWTETRFIDSTYQGRVVTSCQYCNGRTFVERYYIEEEIWEITINYLDDGNDVQQMRSETKLRDHNWNWDILPIHIDSSGSQCGG